MADDIEQPPRGYTTEDVKAIPDDAQQPAPRRRRLARWKLFLLALVVVPVLVFGLWTWAALNWSYSDGDRNGWVQKLSRKGWLCKTWEGELAIAPNVPGAMRSEIFHFTVRDDSIAQAINATAGKLVSLHYEEHVGIPSSCFGETKYFVTQVRVVQ
ncbi:MAG: hypothetical protein ACT4PJ_02950 [Gemmatimonadaceae bacterium]